MTNLNHDSDNAIDEVLEVQHETNRKLGEVIVGFWHSRRKLSLTLIIAIFCGFTTILNQLGLLGPPLFWADERSLKKNIQRVEREINIDCDLSSKLEKALTLADEANILGKPRLQERALGLAMTANLTIGEIESAYEIWETAQQEGLNLKSPVSSIKLQSKEKYFRDFDRNISQISVNYMAENVVLGAPIYRIAEAIENDEEAIRTLTSAGPLARQIMFKINFAHRDAANVTLPSWSEVELAVQSRSICRTNKFWMIDFWIRHHSGDVDTVSPAISYVRSLAKTDLELRYSHARSGVFAYHSGDYTKALLEFEYLLEQPKLDENTQFSVDLRRTQSKMVLAQSCYKDTEYLIDSAIGNGKVHTYHRDLTRLVERCVDDWSNNKRSVELYDKLIGATPNLDEEKIGHLICNALNDVGDTEFQSRAICRKIESKPFESLSYKQAESRVGWAYRDYKYKDVIQLIDQILDEPLYNLSEWNIAYLKARRGLSNFNLEKLDEAKSDFLSALEFYGAKDGVFTQWQTTLYKHLVIIYSIEGDLSSAIETNDRLWLAIKETGNIYDKAQALEISTVVSQEAGRFQDSHDYADEWARVTKDRSNLRPHFDALAALGNVQIRLGREEGVQDYLGSIDSDNLSEYGLWERKILSLVPHRVNKRYDFVDARLSDLLNSPMALVEHSFHMRVLIALLVFDTERYNIEQLRKIDPLCEELDHYGTELNVAQCSVRYTVGDPKLAIEALKKALTNASKQGLYINDAIAGMDKYVNCTTAIAEEAPEVFDRKFRNCMTYLRQSLRHTKQEGMDNFLVEKYDRNASSLGLPPLVDKLK